MKTRRFFLGRFLVLLLSTLLCTVACQSQAPSPAPTGSPGGSPSSPAASSVIVNGTGATFPLFLYERWFYEYNRLHPNIKVNYQPVGSAAGIQQLVSGTVDFAASDVAMTDEEIAKVAQGVVMLPMTAGSVAIAYNLPSLQGQLKLPRSVYPSIFLGTITRWNDPAIAAANPDLTLPDLPIILVHRSDGSGTTAVFTSHLAAISPAWKSQVGSGLNVQWPAGVGIKSNAGVSAQIQQAEGAIGYVEFSYAKQLDIAIAALENRSGQFIAPGPKSTAQGLEGVTLPENLRVFVTDPTAAGAYPIITYSWLLAYRNYEKPETAAILRELFKWGLTEGQAFSEELGYVPLPTPVVEKTLAALEQIGP